MADLLIIDDDADVAALLAEALREAGHSCRVGQNGREGLALVADRRPEVVLLDVEMPIMNGPEMAYTLFVRNCGDEKIPLILISGIVGLPVVAASVATPYYLGKPYAVESVLQLVNRALAERIYPRQELSS